MATYISILLSVFLLISAGCSSETESGQAAERPTAIAGYELSPIVLSRIIRASSVVEAENVVTLASRLSGLIIEMNVREGDRLSEGDVLLRFDIEEQQAELERARAEFDLASAVYERNQTLFTIDAVSLAEYEEARANKELLEVKLNCLKPALDLDPSVPLTIWLY